MLSRVLIVVLLSGVPRLAHAQAHCFDYESPNVELTGTLVRRVLAGPPNYESIKGGDRPDTVWVLRLTRSICLRPLGVAETRTGVKEVQLIVPEEDHLRMRTYLDRPTMFRGTLRAWEWGFHHLPVVFWSRVVMIDMRAS